MIRIAWISDTHLLPEGQLLFGKDPCVCSRAAFKHVSEHYADADLCVVSGDLAQKGTPEAYILFREMADSLPMPVLSLPGNHDDREHFRTVLGEDDTTCPGFLQWVRDVGDFRLIGLDTLVPGKPYGHLCPDRLQWLERQLENARTEARPVLLFLHHPPLDLGLQVMDTIRLKNGEELYELLTRFFCIRHMFFGHSHRTSSGVAHGIPYCGLGSPVFQGPLSWRDTDLASFTPADEPGILGLISASSDQVTVHFQPL